MRNAHGQPQHGFLFVLLVLFCFLAGCSGEGTPSGTIPSTGPDTIPDTTSVPPPGPRSTLSTLTEASSSTQFIPAAAGGHVSNGAVTVTFPAAVLPADASIKVAKVTVSNSEQDPSLIDMTDAYVISAPSAAEELELEDSANIVFKVDPTGIDEASIRLVIWDGYEWEEVPTTYDATLKAVTATVEALLPSGTRIYLANPEANTTDERDGGEQVVSEFVAMKVVGERATGTPQQKAALRKAAVTSAVIKPGRTVFLTSPDGRFKVSYTQPQDSAEALALKAQAEAVAGYMDNAYKTIVTGMGLKQPAKTTKANYGKTWPVDLETIRGAYGVADPGTNSISIAAGASPGDGLSHTCHHEFTHLVQFETLKPNNSVEDSLDWFGETMADAIGYYAQKGLGTIYALAGESMGYFNVRLDADKHTLGRENDDYEYRHFPFISYLLAVYGDAKFKKFFETWYSYTPGSTQINMTTIDTAAAAGLGKPITGRDGIFWDFYRDYFIAGTVFNQDKFKNLAGRQKGKPYDVTEEEKEKQGVTLVEVSAGVSYRQEFTIQRLAGQVVILRYKGDAPLGLSVTVTSLPGLSSGRIQLVPFKRAGGLLLPAGGAVEVSDSGTKTIDYSGVGTDVHDIYLVMTNTAGKADDYKVTVVVAEKS